jgi:hypothetical protein
MELKNLLFRLKTEIGFSKAGLLEKFHRLKTNQRRRHWRNVAVQ